MPLDELIMSPKGLIRTPEVFRVSIQGPTILLEEFVNVTEGT